MIPRVGTCGMPRCRKPGDREIGICYSCKRFLCYTHALSHHSECPAPIPTEPEAADVATWESRTEADLSYTASRVNDAAVCAYASSLNGGRECSVEHLTKPDTWMWGAANYHARVRFHDGAPSWLLRVPHARDCDTNLPPDSLRDYIISSEYATLKFLETTTVPAPRAFGYGLISDGTDRGVGVTFLLMEELPGEPWYMGGGPLPATRGFTEAAELARDREKIRNHNIFTKDGKRVKLWSDVADIMAELARHPFPKAGSLTMRGDSIEVGPVASDRFRAIDPDGPFDSSADYYTAWAEQYLALIADGQLYGAYPVEAYLVHRFLKDNVWQLIEEERRVPQEPEQFFLKHVDDVGHHLLIDKDLNVTGIIDWQMARVVPPSEAFGPSLVSAEINRLVKNIQGPSVRDSALEVAMCQGGYHHFGRWWQHDKVRRFFWGLALEPEWLLAAKGILEAFGVHEEWEVWRARALKEYSKADKRLRLLRRRVRARSVQPSSDRYNLRKLVGRGAARQ